MDEYQIEIRALRRTLARLKAEKAKEELIQEYEAELRILTSLYAAATETHAAGLKDRRLPRALDELGFGVWTLQNVYSFVYEAALDMGEAGHDLAARVGQTDFVRSLLAEA